MAAPVVDIGAGSDGNARQLLAEPAAEVPVRQKAFDPGAYALRREWWSVFGMTSAMSILLAFFSLGYALISTKVPKLWQGEAYEDALKAEDLGALAASGRWWFILVGATTGLLTGVIRVVTKYPLDVHGLMAHLATQHMEWEQSWKTSLLTLLSQMGGSSLGLEAGVAAAGCGLAAYIAEKSEFDHAIQKVFFTSSLSAVFGALFPMPILAPLMIVEGAAAPAPGTKMSLFAVNSLSALAGFFVYVAVQGYPYLAEIEGMGQGDQDHTTIGKILLVVLIGILSAVVVLVLGTLVHFGTYLANAARKSMNPSLGMIVVCTLGGVLYGICMLAFPLTIGTGHELIKPAVLYPERITSLTLFASLIAKMFSFAIAQACGFEGGPLFCPITLGVFLGVLVQSVAASMGHVNNAKVLAAAGMAGVSGAGPTPFTNTVMTLFLLKLSGHFTWVPLLSAIVAHVLLVGLGMLRFAKMANPLKAQLT